jgi:hypothetical protein
MNQKNNIWLNIVGITLLLLFSVTFLTRNLVSYGFLVPDETINYALPFFKKMKVILIQHQLLMRLHKLIFSSLVALLLTTTKFYQENLLVTP